MKRIFKIIAVILVVIIGVAAGGLYYIDSKIFVSSKKGSKHSIINSISAFQSVINSVSNQGGLDNIILTGTDARSKDTSSRTDSIMMATVDRSNKEIKLTSFMRDMYVPIPGYKKNYKINTAYFLGGADLLLQTLNQNFNTNAQYYVNIDFSAFQALVDKFDGIDVDVKSYEIKEMNKYIKEENWGNPDFVTKSGFQHLNGQQVLSYCRIRKVGNNDYERTERQRRVLSLLIKKARKESILDLPNLMNTILPFIKTNIPSTKLLALGISAYKFSGTAVSTLRIPADGMYDNQVIGGQDVLVPDLQQNASALTKFVTTKTSTDNKEVADTTKNTATESTKTIDVNNNDGVDKNSQSQVDSKETSGSTTKSNIDVCILNSTGKAGLAAKYKTKLEALGYTVAKTDNYPYKKYKTTIINDYSKQGYGTIISGDLKFGNIVKKQKAKPVASIVIILGRDSVIN